MKFLKIMTRWMISGVLLIFICWGITFGILQTKQGQTWLFNHLIHYIEQKTETQIHVEEIKFSFPLKLQLGHLTIFQENRPLAKIHSLELSCNYLRLLEGRFVCPVLQVSGIEILSWPHHSSEMASQHSDPPWNLYFPFYLRIETVNIQRIHLAPEVIDSLALSDPIKEKISRSSFSLQGTISNYSFKKAMAAHLLITAQDNLPRSAPLNLGIDTQNHQLSLSFHSKHFPLHLIHSDMPPSLKVQLALYASAPISTWLALVQKDSSIDELSPLTGHFKVSLQAEEDGSPLSSLIGQKTMLKSQYLVNSKSEIKLFELQIKSPSLFLDGTTILTTDQEIRQGHFTGTLNSFDPLHSLLGQEIAGRLDFEGEVTGHLHSPSLDLQLLETPLSGTAKLKIHVSSLVEASDQKRQRVSGEWIGQNIQWREWKAEQLKLSFQADPIHGEISSFQVHSQVEGQQIHWQDKSLASFAATATCQTDLETRALTHLSTEWKAQGIRWEAGEIAQAAGQACLPHPLQAIEGTLEMALYHIQTPTLQLEELIGSTLIDFSQAQWPFRLQGDGQWKEKISFMAEGTWHQHQDLFELRANHLSGQLGPYPFQFMQPVRLLRGAEDMQLTDLHVQWGEVELQGEYRQYRDTFTSQFKTNAISTELFHPLTPHLPLTGDVTFIGQLEGSLKQPRGHVQMMLHHAQIAEEIFVKKPLIEGDIHLHLNPEEVQIKSDIYGIGTTPVVISGVLPIQLSLDPVEVKMPSNLPLDLSLHAEGELDSYLHLLYNDQTTLSGQAWISLRLSGPMDAPQIQGHIDLLNGTYESLSTGALYHDIHAHLEGDGSRILLTQFYAHDNKSGSITATGEIALDGKRDFPFEFQIQSNDIFIVDSDYAAISASGHLSLVGNHKEAKLQGALVADQFAIRLEETLPRQVKMVDVKYINLPEGEPLPAYLEPKEGSSAIALDVKLQIPQQATIQGQHLSSEWRGAIEVTGTPESPLVNGDLRLVHGEYDFNGKSFDLTQGNIHFAGPIEKRTTLYIVASQEIDRIRAEIIVKGPVNKPSISFRSNPPLSQREVLSYILFNRGISDITSDQGDQLNQSFISLNASDSKGSDDFLSRIRNHIGIDRLDFTSSDKENKDFSLQVGKYITESVFVSINKSINDAPNRVAIEVNLPKNFKVQADAADDAQVRTSLKWKKDY